MRPFFLTLLLLGPCIAWTSSQASDAAGFSSSYTDLSKDCKWRFKATEMKDGQDNSLVCRGHGGYGLQIDPSAKYSALHVALQGTDFSSPEAPFLKDPQKGMVEWRTADGKPFAVIVRSLELDKQGEAIGERLAVIGLKGFESLQESVKTQGNPRANEQARGLADAAYSRIRRSAP